MINKRKVFQTKKMLIIKYSVGVFFIFLGLLFNINKIGMSEENFFSLGSFFIRIGLIMVIILSIVFFRRKEKYIDERNFYISNIALRFAFNIFLIVSFAIIILDVIFILDIGLSETLSFLICLVIIIYAIVYNILEKRG